MISYILKLRSSIISTIFHYRECILLPALSIVYAGVDIINKPSLARPINGILSSRHTFLRFRLSSCSAWNIRYGINQHHHIAIIAFTLIISYFLVDAVFGRYSYRDKMMWPSLTMPLLISSMRRAYTFSFGQMHASLNEYRPRPSLSLKWGAVFADDSFWGLIFINPITTMSQHASSIIIGWRGSNCRRAQWASVSAEVVSSFNKYRKLEAPMIVGNHLVTFQYGFGFAFHSQLL